MIEDGYGIVYKTVEESLEEDIKKIERQIKQLRNRKKQLINQLNQEKHKK